MTRRIFMSLALLPIVPVWLGNRMVSRSGYRVIPAGPRRRIVLDGLLLDIENPSKVLYEVWPRGGNATQIVLNSCGGEFQMHSANIEWNVSPRRLL